MDSYVNGLVRVLDTIKYRDNNYEHHERVKTMRDAYSEAAKHFAQPLQQNTVQVNPKGLEAAVRTGVWFVVCSFPKAPPEAMGNLAIPWTYYVFLDHSANNPHLEMASFFEDLILGRQQKHPWWRLMNDHLPKVLSFYGNFCGFIIVRNSMDCKWLALPKVLDLGQF